MKISTKEELIENFKNIQSQLDRGKFLFWLVLIIATLAAVSISNNVSGNKQSLDSYYEAIKEMKDAYDKYRKMTDSIFESGTKELVYVKMRLQEMESKHNAGVSKLGGFSENTANNINKLEARITRLENQNTMLRKKILEILQKMREK